MTDFESDAATILHNLALERTGWRRYVFGRWYIAAAEMAEDEVMEGGWPPEEEV